ncbi:hypothetical protein OG453_35200 [Streptomyces sp. NBC_01381]|uniref:hypothetical protein n=1 Tax=Streptomyces sp. NBC_01381 TaxID=2903845 RepID=UPI0022510D88|nr:hypothetical protein [Streptomyces sp. NBC_01381]MCX4671872.1 hypothetical protein [Streptomyces sp. NBC_01381]
MLITRKRTKARTLIATSALLLAAFGAAGCSGDSSAAESGSSKSPGTKDKGFTQALAYSKCMRANGVPDYPDPEQDADGRVIMNPGNGQNDPKTQQAMEACRDKMPQGRSRENGGKMDTSKVTSWAKCIRENGIPKFPDPEIDGTRLNVPLGKIGMMPDDPKMQKASQACQDKSPGGELYFTDGSEQ